jgi:hypothetical protein
LFHWFKNVAYDVIKYNIFTPYYLNEKLQNPLKLAASEHKHGNGIIKCSQQDRVSGIKRIWKCLGKLFFPAHGPEKQLWESERLVYQS